MLIENYEFSEKDLELKIGSPMKSNSVLSVKPGLEWVGCLCASVPTGGPWGIAMAAAMW